MFRKFDRISTNLGLNEKCIIHEELGDRNHNVQEPNSKEPFFLFFRYELIDILRNNNFATPEIRIADVYVSNKRAKQTQRRILKGFNINTVESALAEAFTNAKNDGEKSKDFFKVVAKAIGNKDRSKCLS